MTTHVQVGAFLSLARSILDADIVLSFVWIDERTASVRDVVARDAATEAISGDESLIISLPRTELELAGGTIFEGERPRRLLSSALSNRLPAPASAVFVTTVGATGHASTGGLIAVWFSPDAIGAASAACIRCEHDLGAVLASMLLPDVRSMEVERLAIRFDAMMATMHQAVVFIDDETGGGLVNHAGAALLDVAPGAVSALLLAERMGALRDAAQLGALTGDMAGIGKSGLWRLPAPHRRALRVTSVAMDREGLRGRLWMFDDVTHEVDAERKARESDERFRSALDGMRYAFFILRAIRDAVGAVEDFQFVEVNAEGALLARRTRDEMVGARLTVDFPSARASGVYDIYRQVVETGVRYDGEYQTLDERNAGRWLRLQVVPTADGVAVTSRDITERILSEEALRELAVNDELTGLLNRRGFKQAAEHAMLVAKRRGQHDALLYIDLDDFKPINDVYGHAEGDEVLRIVARTLKEVARGSDHVGRLGGDEFVVYATALGQSGEGILLAERIHQAIAANNADAGNRPYRIGLSIGVAEVARDESYETLAARADAELYTAKRARKALDIPRELLKYQHS